MNDTWNEPADPVGETVEFDAVLQPHRSLGPRGFMLLMGFIGVVSFVAGIVFTIKGAWPVFGFFGLDVLAIYIAFRINYRAARLHERVQISSSLVKIRRTLPNGLSRDWRFNPYWARIEAGGALKGEGVLVRSHGDTVLLGSFLTEEEQEDFAMALEEALSRARAQVNPVA